MKCVCAARKRHSARVAQRRTGARRAGHPRGKRPGPRGGGPGPRGGHQPAAGSKLGSDAWLIKALLIRWRGRRLLSEGQQSTPTDGAPDRPLHSGGTRHPRALALRERLRLQPRLGGHRRPAPRSRPPAEVEDPSTNSDDTEEEEEEAAAAPVPGNLTGEFDARAPFSFFFFFNTWLSTPFGLEHGKNESSTFFPLTKFSCCHLMILCFVFVFDFFYCNLWVFHSASTLPKLLLMQPETHGQAQQQTGEASTSVESTPFRKPGLNSLRRAP